MFGLSGGELRPCDDSSFASAKPTHIVDAYAFSVTWERDRMYFATGLTYEMSLPNGKPQAVDLGPYSADTLAVAPEGDGMFFTVAFEPPMLLGAVQTGSAWASDPLVPLGTYAGTPTAAAFGPRRVLVRLRYSLSQVQEYEDDGNTWQPVGPVHSIPGDFAPNLTPAGFDMVYADHAGAVWIAHRPSVGEWFGDATMILDGQHQFPQLLDRCHELYVIDLPIDSGAQTAVQRYAR